MSSIISVFRFLLCERQKIKMISGLSVLLCLVAAVSAQFAGQYQGQYPGQYPSNTNYYNNNYQKNVVPILSQDFQIAPDGRSYQFNYASADGSHRQETGVQNGPESYSVTGSFEYTLPNGAPVQVQYVSDEFGYQPSGPGVHPDIAKAVAEQVAEAKGSPYNNQYSNYPGAYRPVFG